MQVDRSAAQVGQTDLVLIPGFLFTLKEALPGFSAYGPWLRRQHAQGALIASMCTGAFMLAENGLLEGLRATTHWAFAEPVLIDDLARRFGFGIRNFKRRFKEATGHTPIAYLQTLRLERAKQLLESTRMTPDSITHAVGYEDSNSLRRLFQQRVGLLPVTYRKKCQTALTDSAP